MATTTAKTLHPFAARALARVRSVNPRHLAAAADDAGARWARQIIEDVAEAIEYANPAGPDDIDTLADEQAAELADGAVPIYTADLFRVVLSLQAWHEPIDEFGAARDLLDAARRAVYLIAERIVFDLLDDAKLHADDRDPWGLPPWPGQACAGCGRQNLDTEACPNVKTECIDCCGEEH